MALSATYITEICVPLILSCRLLVLNTVPSVQCTVVWDEIGILAHINQVIVVLYTVQSLQCTVGWNEIGVLAHINQVIGVVPSFREENCIL